MARIIQIRRGSATEHENFTGAIGEITMDTDNKTLRIHDGQTLGGFQLARADQITNRGDTGDGVFDINSVSDEFWTGLFERFGQPAPVQYESAQMRVNALTIATEYVFSEINTIPRNVRVVLECISPEAGYIIGEQVSAFGIGDRNNPQPNTYVDDRGLHVCLMVAKQQYWVNHKTEGTKTFITADNWRVKFYVYG